MELSRLRRMVRARWWIILAMALLGAVAGGVFTNLNNDNIEPRFRAVGSIMFEAVSAGDDEAAAAGRGGEGASGADAAALVEEALVVAEEVNADLLEQPGVEIVAAQNEPRIDFATVQPSEDAARALVEEMRGNYVAVDPTSLDVDAEIDSVIARSTVINERIGELTPPEPPAAPPISLADQARISVFETEIAALEAQLGLLFDERLDLDPDEDAEQLAAIDNQVDDIRVQLTRLRRNINRLTPPEPEVPEFELTAAEQLEKTALESELEQLSLRYQELQALREGGGNTITLLDMEIEDQTPAPTSMALSVVIGLIGGAIAGLAAIIFMDRVQGTVWTRTDLEPMPLLAEMPQQSGGVLRSRRHKALRQKGVQSIRSALLGIFHAAGPTTIGFTGLGSADDSVSSLVLDVARSLAGVGRSVLLIDGQIGGLAALRSEVAGGSTLAELSTDDTDTAALETGVGDILARVRRLGPNLAVLPGDPRTTDSVDVLASKSFRILTEQASLQNDIVIVVGPSALSPFAYVMAGLVSAYVVVTTMGRTRQRHIEALAKQFAGSPGRLVGAVLLGVSARRGFVPASDLGPQTSAEPARPDAENGRGDAGGVEQPAAGGILDKLGESLASLAGDKQDD